MPLSRRVLLGTVAAAAVLPASRGRAQQAPICLGVLNDQSGLYRTLAARPRCSRRTWRPRISAGACSADRSR